MQSFSSSFCSLRGLRRKFNLSLRWFFFFSLKPLNSHLGWYIWETACPGSNSVFTRTLECPLGKKIVWKFILLSKSSLSGETISIHALIPTKCGIAVILQLWKNSRKIGVDLSCNVASYILPTWEIIPPTTPHDRSEP